MEDIKIYTPINVIDNLNNNGLPVKITCVECCSSRLFVGTLEGIFFEYFITQDESKYSKVRSIVIGKGQPVVYIRSASALDSVIILCGGTLALYDLQTLEIKGSNNAGNVTAVSVDENPVGGDPFIVELCFSRKTSIFICHVSSDGFKLVREINLESLAISLSIESGLICAALAVGHYIMVNAHSPRKSVQKLCDFDSREVQAKVVHVKKEEFLVLGPGSLGVFVNSDGVSERPPISWPTDRVNQVTVHNLNVVAVINGSVFVHSLLDPTHCASVRLENVRSLQVVEGNLFVWTGSNLYKFQAVSVDEQVESLLASDDISKAFNILQNAGPAKQHYLSSKIHRKAAFVYLAASDYESARDSLTEGGVDLREILVLYKNVLPSSSTFTQTLPPLHRFSDIGQIATDESTLRELSQFVITLLLENERTNSMQDLSTSLLKLTAKFDSTKFKLLLRKLSLLNADFDDVIRYFETTKMYSSSALLHKALGKLEKSLDLWLTLSELQSDNSEPVSIIVDLLVDCTDPVVVWKYFYKLEKIDSAQAVEIFKRKAIDDKFQPLKVAEKLHSFADLCIEYLEHVVYDKRIQDTEIHTYLATLYIEKISAAKTSKSMPAAPSSDGPQTTRDKLLQLLVESNNLRCQFLIGKLQNSTLRLELAILLGKTGDHRQALLVMIKQLDDHKLAREYCRKLGNLSDKRRAYLELLRLYIEIPEESQTSQNIENLVEVLSDFIQDFDLIAVLSLLPDDIPLSIISRVLHKAARIVVHKRRRAQLTKSLSTVVHTEVKLEEFENNLGFAAEEDSICDACNKLLDGIDTINFSAGLVGHDKCLW